MKKIVFFVLLCIIFINFVDAENIYERKSTYKINNDSFAVVDGVNESRNYLYREYAADTKWVEENLYFDYIYGDGNRNIYFGIEKNEKEPIVKQIVGNDTNAVHYVYFDTDKTILINSKEDGTFFSVYDNELKIVKELLLPESFKVNSHDRFGFLTEGIGVFNINKLNDGKYYLARNLNSSYYIENNSCNLVEISNDFSEITELDCNDENLSTYFPDVVFAYENELLAEKYDKNGDKLAYTKDNKFLFYDGEEKIFELEAKENETFNNFKILNNKIILIKSVDLKSVGYYKDESDERKNVLTFDEPTTYFDSVLIYDFEGNLLQTISDNASYIGLDVNKKTNEFVLLRKYTDGLATQAYYGNMRVETFLTRDIYSEVLGVDSGNQKPDTPIVNNPNTHDIAIFSFIILFLGSLLFIVARKKVDF